jgi:hypothetical protein
MNKSAACSTILLMALAAAGKTDSVQLTAMSHYSGVCDASTAIPLGEDRFLVADDEDNCLRIYDTSSNKKAAVSQLDLNKFLDAGKGGKEVDWEGATWLGERVVLITSHGNNKEGKPQERRHRLLALKLKDEADKLDAEKVGGPYRDLLKEMIGHPELKSLKLETLGKLAPEKGGVNIEGMSATPDSRLLIGFRSPLIEKRALVVTLLNPNEVLEQSAKPQFARPFRLNLNGLGVRSIEYVKSRKSYLILAGPAGDGVQSRLYEWDGQSEQPRLLADLRPLLSKLKVSQEGNPEALIVYPSGGMQLLLDEGDRLTNVGGVKVKCKDVNKDALENSPCKDAAGKSFTSVRLKLNN